MVFTILALSGFEAVAPLAEETENPKRNLPIVIVLSTAGIAIFYAFVNWGVLVGHGTTSVTAGNFTQSDQIFDLARRLWSGAWILVLIATVNSAWPSRSRSRTRRRAYSSGWGASGHCRAGWGKLTRVGRHLGTRSSR